MKKSTIGWIILVGYWAIMLLQSFGTNQIAWTLGLLFAPFITIPLNIVLNLFVDFWFALADIIVLVLGFYLISKDI